MPLNETSGPLGASKILEFVAAEGSLSRVAITLRGSAAGTSKLVIGAAGEVHYRYLGPTNHAGGASEPIAIRVSR